VAHTTKRYKLYVIRYITLQKPKVCIDYSDAKGVADFSGRNIVIYNVTRERMKKYYQKIFRHLLDFIVLVHT
jgi:imidazoleglycerol phosphate dehydratase HisB